jgi:hypothetical protein
MSILKTQISYIDRIGTEPKVIALNQVLKAISNPVNNRELIQRIRQAESDVQDCKMAGDFEGAKAIKDQRKAPLKLQLPAFIFGAVCEGGHRAEHIVSKTGIVCIDFDSELSTSPAQWETFRDNLINVKYVFYTALSVSASGVMALLQIPDPERQREYFEQMKVDFAGLLQNFDVQGAKLDIGKGGNPAQLRYLTYDPQAKYKAEFAVYDRLPQKKLSSQKKVSGRSDSLQADDVFEYCYKLTTDKAGYTFTHGEDMHHSIFQLCTYLNSFGVSRADAESYIDRNILSLSKIKSNCISYPYEEYKSDFQRYIFEPPEPQQGRKHPEPPPTPYGFNTYTGEVFDQRGYPADWDDVLPPDEGTPGTDEVTRIGLADTQPELAQTRKAILAERGKENQGKRTDLLSTIDKKLSEPINTQKELATDDAGLIRLLADTFDAVIDTTVSPDVINAFWKAQEPTEPSKAWRSMPDDI